MPVQFDGLVICQADGREILHLKSDDLPSDVAELEYLLTRYHVIAEEHSIHLLEKRQQ